jgi:hypothetical protein
MSLADNLAAAEAAVVAVHAQLDKANADLNAAQAAVDAAQPHLSILADIEAEANKLAGDAQAALLDLVAKARALF